MPEGSERSNISSALEQADGSSRFDNASYGKLPSLVILLTIVIGDLIVQVVSGYLIYAVGNSRVIR